ncbi:MAG: 30S ribosomal protein S9 [Verrucomicrobia bacterium]|nr:MAG: 30S ribosomal protein S9 [Verrucomicrobiota bacterium]
MTAKAKPINEFLGTGRRKTATARVRIKPGTGIININGRDLDNYCYTDQLANAATSPLRTVDMEKQIDVIAKVEGGGSNGQAGAIAMGIARALQKMDPELRSPLKQAGHLTRDPRMKERKKSGQPGARKRFQFSKR